MDRGTEATRGIQFKIPADAQPCEPSSLERKATSLRLALLLSAAATFTDVGKMVFSYSLRYRNRGRYPMKQTLVVALTEALKCLLVTGVHGATSGSLRMRPSLKFLLPSVIYMLTNNIFFYALHYVTPAVWLVFVQCRIFLTLFVYKYHFGNPVTPAQWTAGVLILLAVVGSQADGLVTEGRSSDIIMAIMLALLCGTLSTASAVYTEYYYKNDSRSIWEQQSQIYFGSALISAVASTLSDGPFVNSGELVGSVRDFLVATMVFSAAYGLCVAFVMARLDNIIKYHLSATSSVLNTLASALLFPDKFSITPAYVVSLGLLLLAIYLYERKTFTAPQCLRAAFGVVQSKAGVGPRLHLEDDQEYADREALLKGSVRT
ncbi:CMP-sialic acid transporter-like isoform X3 [Amblyomma americanum]